MGGKLIRINYKIKYIYIMDSNENKKISSDLCIYTYLKSFYLNEFFIFTVAIIKYKFQCRQSYPITRLSVHVFSQKEKNSCSLVKNERDWLFLFLMQLSKETNSASNTMIHYKICCDWSSRLATGYPYCCCCFFSPLRSWWIVFLSFFSDEITKRSN